MDSLKDKCNSPCSKTLILLEFDTLLKICGAKTCLKSIFYTHKKDVEYLCLFFTFLLYTLGLRLWTRTSSILHLPSVYIGTEGVDQDLVCPSTFTYLLYTLGLRVWTRTSSVQRRHLLSSTISFKSDVKHFKP